MERLVCGHEVASLDWLDGVIIAATSIQRFLQLSGLLGEGKTFAAESLFDWGSRGGAVDVW